MRILIGCAFLNQHGGFENQVQATAELAGAAGYEVAIYTPNRVPGDATIRRLEPTVRFDSAQETWRRTPLGRSIYSVARMKHYWKNGRRISPDREVELARSRQPADFIETFWHRFGQEIMPDFDVVHLFGKPQPFIVQAARCAARLGKPVVYEEVAQVSEAYAGRVDHQDFIKCSNLCSRVVVMSRSIGREIQKWFRYDGQIEVIEQWAYGEESRLLELAPVRKPDGQVVFGSLSRLGPEKGLDVLLRAFAEALRDAPGIRLRIAGTGLLGPKLHSLARELGISSAVEFLGYVPDKAEFYGSIDVFVVSSREEGGPITGVEAMAAGLPIITTPVGAMPERLRDGEEAIFVDIDSIASFRSALLRLAGAPELCRSMGAASRKKYLARHLEAICGPPKIDLWNAVSCESRSVTSQS